MTVLQFACPRCEAPLRCRLEDVAARPFDCPDCHRPLRVVQQADGTWQPVPAHASSPVAAGERSADDVDPSSILAAAPDVSEIERGSGTSVRRSALHPTDAQSAAEVRDLQAAQTLQAARPKTAAEAPFVGPDAQPEVPARHAPPATSMRVSRTTADRKVPAAATTEPAPKGMPRPARPRSGPSRFEALKSPVAIAWMTAAVVTAGLVVAVVRPFGAARRAGATAPTGTEPGGETVAGSESATKTPSDATQAGAASDPESGSATAGPDRPTEEAVTDLLAEVGRRLAQRTDRDGAFPTGTVSAGRLPPADRFGWIASLAADDLPESVPPPQWDLGWKNPANDGFVRQRQTAWLNPSVPQRVGDLGYPATHFVGVAGTGRDAAALPTGHPRAGLFGDDRRMRREDVRDGLSQTMAVAGVESDLGSWAAGGRASVRPFSQEPYLHGPDGFGTGQPDRMLVLMADGSVRTIVARTDPRVVRRMAAAADGLDLELQQPGEPADPPTATVPPDPVVAENPAKPVPPTDPTGATPPKGTTDPAPTAPPDPTTTPVPAGDPLPVALPDLPKREYDVPQALAQPIVRYDQLSTVPVRQLLAQVEELAGVPIVWDPKTLGADATARLDKPITLTLKETTVGAILQALLDRVDLQYEADKTGIRLVPRPSVAAPNSETPPASPSPRAGS